MVFHQCPRCKRNSSDLLLSSWKIKNMWRTRFYTWHCSTPGHIKMAVDRNNYERDKITTRMNKVWIIIHCNTIIELSIDLDYKTFNAIMTHWKQRISGTKMSTYFSKSPLKGSSHFLVPFTILVRCIIIGLTQK